MVGTSITVAVPTMPGRESLLSRCLWSITEQRADDVQVIVIGGTAGLGAKANLAAELARGDYLTIVDDDDYLAADYMAQTLFCARQRHHDVIGFKVTNLNAGRWESTTTIEGDHGRFGPTRHGPTPKGLTRVDLWRRVPMGDHYTADRDWCLTVAPLVRSSTFIDRHLYIYDFWPHAFGDAGQRDVGWWPFDSSAVERVTLDR